MNLLNILNCRVIVRVRVRISVGVRATYLLTFEDDAALADGVQRAHLTEGFRGL